MYYLTLPYAFPTPRTVTCSDDLNFKYDFIPCHSDLNNYKRICVSQQGTLVA